MSLLLFWHSYHITPAVGAVYSGEESLLSGPLYISTMSEQIRAVYKTGAEDLQRVDYKTEVEQ